MRRETIEKGTCPGCGEQVNFRVIPSPGAGAGHARVHMREPHKAPCGRPCCEGRDATMQKVMSGVAHHPRHCECQKEGKGYQ